MKVLVSGGFAPSLVNFRGALLRAMVERGHSVVACAAEDDHQVRSRLASWSVRYQHVPLARAGTSVTADLKYLASLHRLLRAEGFDLVLSYTHKPVVFTSLAARIASVPRVAALVTGLGYAFLDSGGMKQKVAGHILRTLYRIGAPGIDVVIFQNPDDQKLFRDLRLVSARAVQCIVPGSGIDLEAFPFVSLAVSSPRRFLLVARLVTDKGIREYVEAARIVRQKDPNVIFDLVGWIDSNPAAVSEGELDRWVQAGIIRYHGPQGDVRPFLRDCYGFVLPSYREGTPRTVLEAMSTGRAVITTDAPGCRETVEHGKTGLLVPVRDAQALADAMMSLLSNPDLTEEMGVAGRRRTEDRYDVRHVNSAILEVLGL